MGPRRCVTCRKRYLISVVICAVFGANTVKFTNLADVIVHDSTPEHKGMSFESISPSLQTARGAKNFVPFNSCSPRCVRCPRCRSLRIVVILSNNPTAAVGTAASFMRSPCSCLSIQVITTLVEPMKAGLKILDHIHCCTNGPRPRVIRVPTSLSVFIRKMTLGVYGRHSAGDSKYVEVENWVRFFMDRIFPNMDRPVLVLDDDVVAVGDPCWIFAHRLRGPAALSIRRGFDLSSNLGANFSNVFRHVFHGELPNFRNKSLIGGMMLVNPKRWGDLDLGMRVAKLMSVQLSYRKTGYYLFRLGTLVPLNFVLHDLADELPGEWNLPGFGWMLKKYPTRDTILVHYNGLLKPWLPNALHSDFFLMHYPQELILCSNTDVTQVDHLCPRSRNLWSTALARAKKRFIRPESPLCFPLPPAIEFDS